MSIAAQAVAAIAIAEIGVSARGLGRTPKRRRIKAWRDPQLTPDAR